MRINRFVALINDKLYETSIVKEHFKHPERRREITVAVNGVGHLHIEDIVYCDECKEYHIQLGEKSVTNETTESEVVGTVASTDLNKIEILKAKVVLELVTTHDFPMEAAAEAVEEASKTDPDQWNVNSDSEDLANDLASSDDD